MSSFINDKKNLLCSETLPDQNDSITHILNIDHLFKNMNNHLSRLIYTLVPFTIPYLQKLKLVSYLSTISLQLLQYAEKRFRLALAPISLKTRSFSYNSVYKFE